MSAIYCDYGCGGMGLVVFENGKGCCREYAFLCPGVKKSVIKQRRKRFERRRETCARGTKKRH